MRKENPKFEIFKSFPKDCTSSCLYIAGAGNIAKVGFSKSILNRSKYLLAELEELSGAGFHGIAAFPGAGDIEEERGLIELMKSKFPIFKGNEYFSCHFDDAYPIVHAYCKESRSRFLKSQSQRCTQEIHLLQREILRKINEVESLIAHSQQETIFSAFARQ